MIVVGEPAAVESERDPGGQVHTGDRLGGEVLGGEDDQVGGTAVGVVDEGHDVAVVFGGVGCGRGEDGLAGGGVAAEQMRLDGAGGQVVLEQGVGKRCVGEIAAGRDSGLADGADDGAVTVAVRLGDGPVIDAGEFMGAVIKTLLGDCPGGRVDDPPVQRQRPAPR